MPINEPHPSDDPQFRAALLEYFERQDEGEVIDHDDFVARHEECAAELRSYFVAERAIMNAVGHVGRQGRCISPLAGQ